MRGDHPTQHNAWHQVALSLLCPTGQTPIRCLRLINTVPWRPGESGFSYLPGIIWHETVCPAFCTNLVPLSQHTILYVTLAFIICNSGCDSHQTLEVPVNSRRAIALLKDTAQS